MTFEQWVQLIAPFAAVIIAIISAALSYYFAKKQQILAEERRLKENAYLGFIDAMNHNVMDDDIQEARERLAIARNKLLLIADSQVVIDLCKFTDSIACDRTGEMQQNEQNRLLTEMLKSMRKDLYKKKDINKNYPSVALSGKRRTKVEK